MVTCFLFISNLAKTPKLIIKFLNKTFIQLKNIQKYPQWKYPLRKAFPTDSHRTPEEHVPPFLGFGIQCVLSSNSHMPGIPIICT